MKLKEFRQTLKGFKPFSKIKVNGILSRLVVQSNYAIVIQEFEELHSGKPLHTTLLDYNEIKSLELVLDGSEN